MYNKIRCLIICCISVLKHILRGPLGVLREVLESSLESLGWRIPKYCFISIHMFAYRDVFVVTSAYLYKSNRTSTYVYAPMQMLP